MRSDDEIRADLSYAASGPATKRRLAADVGPLLARAVAAEQERDAALDRERQVIEQWRWQADRADAAEAALDAVRALLKKADNDGRYYGKQYGEIDKEKLRAVLAAAQPETQIHNSSITQPEPTPEDDLARRKALPWYDPEAVPRFEGSETHCRDPRCKDTNWGGTDRVHGRGEDCPPWLAAPTPEPEPTPEGF